MLRERNILRHKILGIKLEGQRNLDRSGLSVRMQMDIEMDLGARLNQATGVSGENIGVLADGVFIEEQPHRVVHRIFHQVGGAMMHNREAQIRLRL